MTDEAVETVAALEQEAKVKRTAAPKKPLRVRKNLDPHTQVTVVNGAYGTLVFVSPKTGERFIFDSFGDEQVIELQDLVAAKNSAKKFFVNNWFLIDDPEILEYLGVDAYYRGAMDLEGFEGFFQLTPAEMAEKIEGLSVGQRKTLAYLAKKRIESGALDSMKKIGTLESCLGVKLIEQK